jgi:cyclopropane fatty-acyl-phospholipid synthase-like methyltransferase
MHNTLIDHKPTDDSRATGTDRRAYPMGYSEGEFERLERQGAFLYDLTEDVLRRAGIKPGMRVLDVGCGAGDVSMLAGALVGPSGAVLGIDRSTQAVEIAKRRGAAAGQVWVQVPA